MRAAVYSRYGPPEVVEIKDVPKPVPKDNEVLVKIHATTVCAADWRLRSGNPPEARIFTGLFRPKKIRVLGMEFSGTIEAAGKSVTQFRAGDEVFGGTLLKLGCHAEYVCLPADGTLALKPANIDFYQAAAFFFGGMTVLGYLDAAPIQAGQRVLVYGASGSVGVFAVQLAKHFGAHVTAVCGTSNLELAKSLGADIVVDYTKQDFSQAGEVYDMVFDTVGKAGYGRSLRSLKRGGKFVLVSGLGKKWLVTNMLAGFAGGLWASAARGVKVVGMPKSGGVQRLLLLKELIEAGKLRTVIERHYSFDQIPEAHRHAEGGHKKGHVVIRIA